MTAVTLCVDAGTTLIKTVVFDEDGRELGVYRRPTAIAQPRRDRSEQNMEEVWDAVAFTVRDAMRAHPGPVRLVAVTAQGDGAWLVDDRQRAVRPAVLWNDSRAADHVDRWAHDGVLEQAFSINRSLTNAGLPNAILAALRAEEPEAIERASSVLTCGSWLYLRLSGRLGLHISEASAPWLDVQTGAYSDALLGLYGLDDLAHLLPPIFDGDGLVGAITAAASEHTGLAIGTPVVLAPYDVVATAAGVGAVRTGQVCGILGTTLCVATVLDDPLLEGRASGLTLSTGDGHYVRAFPTLTGTGLIDWIAALCGLEGPGEVSALAAASVPGANGLRLWPYLSPAGERAPFLEPHASGLLGGLNLMHGREDLARAALEGLSFMVHECMTAAGSMPDEVTISGGGAASDVWSQLIADITTVQTMRTHDRQAGAKGALMHALVAVSELDSLEHARRELVRYGDCFTPSPDNRALYAGLREQFVSERESLVPLWRRWASTGNASRAGNE